MPSTTLKLKFGTMSGEKTWNFKYAKANTTTENVKNVVSKMIENGSIYKYPPLTAVSATLVTTSETEVDLS